MVIANPKWVKAVKGNKDDTKDSKWIGDLFRIGLVKSSFIPNKDIRILRELTRYRYKLISMKSSEKNRFQNAFTVCNVALDSVVSDMFGKSATAITDYLTSDVEFDAQHCISLLQRSLKKKAPAILEAVEGHEIAPEQKTRIGIVRDHLHYIDKLVERVDDCVEGMVQKHEGSITLLRTIPGVDRSSAIIKASLRNFLRTVRRPRSSQFSKSSRKLRSPCIPLNRIRITNRSDRSDLLFFCLSLTESHLLDPRFILFFGFSR